MGDLAMLGLGFILGVIVMCIFTGGKIIEEIERLKQGYCELKEKCNRGECDCTHEEYNEMCKQNMKMDLEIKRLNKIIEIKNNRIQQLMKRTRSTRIDKAIEYIKDNLYPVGNDVNGSDLPYDEAIQPLVDILKGDDKE